MKKQIKMILSFILTMLLAASVIPVYAADAAAITANGTCGADGDNITWTLYEDGTLVLEGTGAMQDYIISDSASTLPYWCSYASVTDAIIGDGITTIGSGAFQRSDLVSIHIPESVEIIKKNAFYDCRDFSVVTGCAGVEIIENRAFYYCEKLEGIYLAECISIGDYAFEHCDALADITLSDNLQTIGVRAFESCGSIADFYIGKNLTSIGYGAFFYTRMESFEVNSENTAYTTDDCGVLFDISKTTLIKYPSACELTAYTMPDSVKYLEDYAFYTAWNLVDLTLSQKLISIGESCFYYCFNIKAFNLPDSLETIGNVAFGFCLSITELSIPDNVSSLTYLTLYGCTNLQKLYIGKNCGYDDILFLFYTCVNLTDVEVHPENLWFSTDEYGVVFNKDKTALICYPAGKTYTSYTVPEGVAYIYDFSFYASTLESVTLPASLKTIAEGAFIDCLNLTQVNILTDDVSIADIAFGTEMLLQDISMAQYAEMLFAAEQYVVMGDHATYENMLAEMEKYVVETYDDYWKQIATFNLHDDGRTYSAEAYAQEKGITVNTCHFYSEDWVYDYDNLVRYKECTVDNCDAVLTEELERSEDENVDIIAPADPDTEVEVEVIPESGDKYILIEEALDSAENEYEILKAFDINFKNHDGVHVQPDGTVKVKLPLDWEKDGNYKVFRVNDDGTLTDMNAFRQGSHMVFETDHFSIYVIVEQVAESTEDTTAPEEDTTVPEEDTTVPEEDTTVPEDDTQKDNTSDNDHANEIAGFFKALFSFVMSVFNFFARILELAGLK